MHPEGCGGKPPRTEGSNDRLKPNERTDASGVRWRKVYTGGGAHFRHWLEQFKEIYGEENLRVEEEDSTGFACFEQSGEKMYSIWQKIGERES